MATTLPASATVQEDARTRETSINLQAALALLVGGLIIGIAGFSHQAVVHNAAHDARHSTGFPCH